MSTENKILKNPYQYYYEEIRAEDLSKSETADPEFDEYTNIDADPRYIQKIFNKQIKEAEKRAKDSNDGKWVPKAMRQDPAFMLDPVKDYYLPRIPLALRKTLSEDQLMEFVALEDPITWAQRSLSQKHGGWKARVSRKGFPYQSQMIRCQSKRIASRAGRRIGKSAALVVRILHKIFTFISDNKNQTYNVIIFTPNQAQIDLLFKMMDLFIDGNENLLSMVKDGKIPTRKSPYHMLELTNGATVKGFVSGSTAIRGQAANMLILDEGSFLTEEDTDSVVALLAENEDVEFWVSSTPKGLKDYFYDRVMDPKYVSFYFPTNEFHPSWSHAMEMEFRSQLTDSGYKHEVLADFSADGEGVYQHQFISRALYDYMYSEQKRTLGWVYGIGVDWNDVKNGTQIVVVGYDRANQKYRVVDKASVSIEGWTQTTAVDKVVEFNRKWRCSFIYVDAGFGGAQIEMIHAKGMKAPANSIDKKLLKAKSVNFSSTINIRDPWTKQKVKKPMKPYMVNNSVRVLENDYLELSINDDLLKKQMEGYVIERITPSGTPVYGSDPKYGDHILDALILALFGFHMEFSSLSKPRIASNIGQIGQEEKEFVNPQRVADQLLQRDKEKERREYEEAWAHVKTDEIEGLNKRRSGIRSVKLNKTKRTSRPPIRRRSF